MLNTVRVSTTLVPIFEKAQASVQRYFEALRFHPERGTISVEDERYVLVRARALSVEFFDVVRELYGAAGDQGNQIASEILFDVAHAMGMSDARVFAEKLGVEDPVERLSAGPIHFAHAGWAFVDLHPESRPVRGDDFVTYFDHPYSMEADGWLAAGRVASMPVCLMNAGYSSGWCESSFGQPLVSAEVTCRAKGDEHCRFIMAPPSRIEARIHEYALNHPGVVPDPRAVPVPGFFRRKASSEAIHARAAQLSAENAELERRVAQRTSELVEANQALTRELSERKEAEAALRDAQEVNRRIIDAVPSGIVLVAADGSIRSANDEAQAILGVAYDELTRSYTTDFANVTVSEGGEAVAPDDYPVSRALATGTPQGPVTLGVRRPDGATSWAIFRAIPLRDAATSAPSGAIVTFVDITQRKADEELRRRLEEQVQRSQKLESLGLLAGGVAHDFNNLLVGILGNASWLARGLEPESREWQATQHIAAAGRRAADLTKQMLAYAGRARVEAVFVDVRDVLSELRALLPSSLPARVQVSYVLADEVLPVSADPAQLGQVVMNLITNACEAASEQHPEAGQVRVHASRVHLSDTQLQQMHEHERAQAGQFVCVRITDDGVGLTADALTHAFDPFFTTKKDGHGLGLAAVFGILRAHAGALDIQSEVGVGTTVRVYLPECDPPLDEAPGEPSSADTAPLAGLFLVVDDEPAVRTVATTVLTQLGLQVVDARDGSEGLAVYRQRQREVRGMLLDLTMPVMNGLDVMREVRATNPTLPIVLCSGYDRNEVLDQLAPDPCCVFLPKPFTAEQLERAVRAALS